jgi:AcrR family transcriptional regulator
MSASSVFYYYPALGDLLQDVAREALGRFCEDRAEAISHIGDPRRRLRAMIRTGLPASTDDELCRLLYELGSLARREPRQAARYVALYERQVAIYVGILEAGAALGLFKLATDSITIARNLVVLEDGFGLHVTMSVPTFDIEAAERLVVSYATIATGCDLAAIPLQDSDLEPTRERA